MKATLVLLIGLISLTSHAKQKNERSHHHNGSHHFMGEHMPMMTPEMHKEMAKMHSEMATCLESNKPKEECQNIMYKQQSQFCAEHGKNQNCPYHNDDEQNKKSDDSKTKK